MVVEQPRKTYRFWQDGGGYDRNIFTREAAVNSAQYIHMNPVKDKIVKHPREYNWSSYNDYANKRNLSIVNKELLIGTFCDVENFIEQTLIYDVKDRP